MTDPPGANELEQQVADLQRRVERLEKLNDIEGSDEDTTDFPILEAEE